MKLINSPPVDIRGVFFDNVTLEDAVGAIMTEAVSGESFAAVYTPNSEIVQRCVEDKTGELYGVINSAELIIPDSTGIIKAAKIFGTPLCGKVAGVEVGEAVLRSSAERGVPVYFLGGKPGVAEAAKSRMEAKYPGLAVVGTADGYFDKSAAASAEVISRVRDTGARILYVCLGAPTQEIWIYENRRPLADAGIRVALALGGSLDIYSGTARRAPKIFIKLGFEWFYRLLREPYRFGRMMALPRFYIGCRREAKLRRRKK